MTNKKSGNDFERELCELLSDKGFWVHNLAQNQAGQPADIIAVKNGRAFLIDAKVCSDDQFPLSRIEENQRLAMEHWEHCRNGSGWFVFKTSVGVYMLTLDIIESMLTVLPNKKSVSVEDMQRHGFEFSEVV